tara:strand:+ start:510 stop:1364 length:855 start_codon:yes stop_codon:yes gene_type:complete
MNYNDITISLVLFRSEKVIFQCLRSINKVKKIIIFDNSNDENLKKIINKKYPNISYILSKKNLGYGAAHNKVLKLAKTPYVLVLNPDTILDKNCIKELIHNANKLNNKFTIISPITKSKNFGYFTDSCEERMDNKNIIDVDFVNGFSMLIKRSKINYFDDNFFLYLEEIDLCKRVKKRKEKIFIIKDSKIRHLAAKSSNIGFEFDKCRNWHWMWSKVYYDTKHNNFFYALKNAFFPILFNYVKGILFFSFNKKKSIIYFLRASGKINAIVGKNSWYRPKLSSTD